ncbi:MAG: metal-dependent hydrolase [Helicobacteraceae bacterium]|nr:metal-dependent hydrolase [Helicobacteraceae bacterium]
MSINRIKLIGASVVITCNKYFEIIKNGGILFDNDRILKIGDFYELQKSKKIQGIFYNSSVITPAFLNAHIHFEFSNNNTLLKYGNFGEWLDSVIKNRNELLQDSRDSIKEAIKESLKSGVVSVGAISSNGIDLEPLSQSPLKVVFFNEIMGTSEENLEQIKDDFDTRFKKSLLLSNERFRAAIALHSPYSLHNKLATYAIERAKEHKMLLSAHFLESKEELLWLEFNKGYFKNFFKQNNPKPFYTRESFLRLFSECESLFTHCLYLNNDDFAYISKLNADIVSCPRSNRLLNNRYFNFFKAMDFKLPLIIATDGKSSNNSLNILDEARVALFAYHNFNINFLAKEILLSITARPAKRLKFNNGFLEKNQASDFAIFNIKDIDKSTQIPLDFILKAKEVQDLYINGERIDIENY